MAGFEWDEEKRRRNIEDHGLDFRLAARIFAHPVLESEDRRRDYGETRFRALGHIDGAFYLVAYTWRGNCRRILSAWKVGCDGRKRYETLLSRGP